MILFARQWHVWYIKYRITRKSFVRYCHFIAISLLHISMLHPLSCSLFFYSYYRKKIEWDALTDFDRNIYKSACFIAIIQNNHSYIKLLASMNIFPKITATIQCENEEKNNLKLSIHIAKWKQCESKRGKKTDTQSAHDSVYNWKWWTIGRERDTAYVESNSFGLAKQW